jgi:hypothetical protein
MGIAYYANEVLTKRWNCIKVKIGYAEDIRYSEKLLQK